MRAVYRPLTAEAYADTEFVADTIAVMDAAGVERAVLVGLCTSSWRALLTAVKHPDRVLGVVAMAPWMPYSSKAPACPLRRRPLPRVRGDRSRGARTGDRRGGGAPSQLPDRRDRRRRPGRVLPGRTRVAGRLPQHMRQAVPAGQLSGRAQGSRRRIRLA